jgi:hypothetical protein
VVRSLIKDAREAGGERDVLQQRFGEGLFAS